MSKLQEQINQFAYCGLMCQECPMYWIPLQETPEKKAAVQIVVADYAKANWGMDQAPETFSGCEGCKGDGLKAGYCAECKIRACAIDKGLASCGLCDEKNTCEMLIGFLEYAGAKTKANLDLMAASR